MFVLEIASKHGKTSAQVSFNICSEMFLHVFWQVVLRWHLQRGHCLVTKSVTPSRIESNIEIGDFFYRHQMNSMFRLCMGRKKITCEARYFLGWWAGFRTRNQPENVERLPNMKHWGFFLVFH